MNKIKVGIIGAGYMGQTHTRTYAGMHNVEVVGVADVVFSEAKRLADQYECKAFEEYKDLLAIPGLDAVSICTPDAIHRDPVVEAAKLKKHILLEKPLATNLEDANVIIDTVKENKVLFQIGFVERFNKSYIVAQQAFQEGSIGNLVSIRTQRMSARYAVERLAKRDDIITFLSVHDIDLMHWFAGSIHKISVEADSFTFPEYPENNDAAFILIRFNSGVLGLVQVTWGIIDTVPFKASATLELIGDKGIIKVDTVDHSVTINSEKGFNNLIGWNRVDAFNSQLSHFINCIGNNEVPRVGLKEGLDSLKIALSAQECVQTGRSIIIND